MRKAFITRITATLIISLATCYGLSAQDSDFYQKTLDINTTGMVILGSWAAGNIITGAIGWSRTSGETMYMHQMNLFWNCVNLTIAGIGLYSNISADPLMMSGPDMLQEHIKYERIYLINAGLDILYMGGGLALRHYSSRSDKRSEMLAGYGKSVIIQGAFLLIFDLAMFGFQYNHRLSLPGDLAAGPAGITWRYTF
jgi:hypothetical protein